MLGQTEHKGPDKNISQPKEEPKVLDRPRRANLASRSASPNKVTPEVHRPEQPQRYRRTATQIPDQTEPERKDHTPPEEKRAVKRITIEREQVTRTSEDEGKGNLGERKRHRKKIETEP